MIRNLLSVIAGIAVATTVFTIFESVLIHKFPLLFFVDKNDNKMKESFMTMLTKALVFILIGNIKGSISAGFIIPIISKPEKSILSIITGAILTFVSMYKLNLFPLPIWFIISSLIIFIPFILVGSFIFRSKFRH